MLFEIFSLIYVVIGMHYRHKCIVYGVYVMSLPSQFRIFKIIIVLYVLYFNIYILQYNILY